MSELTWPFKDPKRIPFEEKYSNLAERWRIDPSLVNYIIRLYTKKLEKALSLLSEGRKITLPRYFADRRTDAEYIYDLIDGWLVEDIICDAWLKSRLEQIEPKIKIKHMGTNRDREIQFDSPRRITTKPDFVYQLPSGKEVKIELQMARELRNSYDMKESKIKRAIKDRSVIYLWILLPSDEYFLLSPVIFEHREPVPNPRWGGKKVYTISISEVKEKNWGVYSMREAIPSTLYGLLGFTEEER